MSIEFKEWPKIPRYRRDVAVSEKIDGTNAAVVWVPSEDGDSLPENVLDVQVLTDQHGNEVGPYFLLAQSRQRFITPAHIQPKNDNYGFAQWVYANSKELAKLGPGYHYGEWWGFGIQRGYGEPQKNFSLFNYQRWLDNPRRPECCRTVPFLGYCKQEGIQGYLDDLIQNGSKASPGYQRPEGIVVFHSQSRQMYKVLIENDDEPKGKRNESAG